MATITRTIRAADGDYTLLSTWESAIPADLVAADEQWVAECYNDWPDGLDDNVEIINHISDTTRNVVITSASGSGTNGANFHDGKVDEGFFISPSSGISAINLSEDHSEARNIRIKGNSAKGITMTYQKTVLIDSVVIHDTTTNGIEFNIHTAIRNTLVVNTSRGFFRASGTPLATADNCTVVGSQYGILRLVVQNCVAYNNSTSDFLQAQTGSDYNASEDSTATGTNSVTGIVSGDFTDTANHDYSLPSDSALVGKGVDLSGTFTDDIIGETRTVPWDIGAFEYIGSTTVAVPNIIGLTAAQADAAITGAGLVVGTVTGDEDPVIAQNPAAGTQVALGSAVDYTLTTALDSVSSSSQFNWDVLTSVSDPLQTNWDVLNTVSDSFQYNWDVLNTVSESFQFDWHIENYGQVTSTLTTSWDIIESASGTLDMPWSLLDGVSNLIDTRWDVLNTVSDPFQFDWHVEAYGQASSTLEASWNVRGPVSSEMSLNWNVTTEVSSELEFAWDAEALVSRDLETNWDVVSDKVRVSREMRVSWGIGGTVSNDLGLHWDVLTGVSETSSINWDVLTEVSEITEINYNVLTATGNSLDFRWDMNQGASGILDMKWNLLSDAVPGLCSNQILLPKTNRQIILRGSKTCP